MSEAPAETLRRAAKLMRERAEAAQTVLPGPWHHQSLGWGYPQPIYNSEGDLVAEGYSGPYTAADVAQYIASWHPLVAKAVADLLDDEAEWAETTPSHKHFPYLDQVMAIARAYLGET